jgi:tetratricopeptide (TPR) repeat protein
VKRSFIAIICLGIIVYSGTFWGGFHFDDMPSIVNNPAIRNIDDLPGIWNYLPRRFILYLSLALNYHFGGLHVFGYHLFNLAVHLGCAVLVWWLTQLILLTPVMKDEKIARHSGVISLLAGLIFVAHPLQTQAVTYIVQRAASMAGLFYLASLCLYAKSRPLGIATGKIYYTGAWIAAVAAMFTKETAITLPLMILFYEFSFLRTRGSLNWQYPAPFLLTLSIIPATIFFTETGAMRLQQLYHEPGISPIHYLLTQFRVMVTYIRLVFFPFNQNLDYDYPIFKSVFEIPVVISLAFLAAIFLCAKQLFAKYRLVSFSIFWFFLTLMPESSLLPIKDVINEHRLYLPLAGYALLLVSGGYYLIGKHSIRIMVIMLLMVIVGNSVLTYQRNKVWDSELALWNDTAEKSPHKARPQYNRGHSFDQKNKYAQAIVDYNKAIELDPDYADAYYNRGLIYARQNNLARAVADFTRTIEIRPNYAGAYNNRGIILAFHGDLDRAAADFLKAIVIDPGYAEAYCNLGNIYFDQGHLPLAILNYKKAIKIAPRDRNAYDNLAIAYRQLNQMPPETNKK